MTPLSELERRLAGHDAPRVEREGKPEAAVALVLREVAGSPEVLFIERAHRDGDPWSGHMAFPGGRRDPGDASSLAAAVRETSEEVGLSLVDGRHLGLLGEMSGGPNRPTNRLVVSAHVFHVVERTESLVPNGEVREAFWFPVDDLLDSSRHVDYAHARTGSARFPGILVGEPERHVVWGLTYRFLELFLQAVGRPLPSRWPTDEIERWARGGSGDTD